MSKLLIPHWTVESIETNVTNFISLYLTFTSFCASLRILLFKFFNSFSFIFNSYFNLFISSLNLFVSLLFCILDIILLALIKSSFNILFSLWDISNFNFNSSFSFLYLFNSFFNFFISLYWFCIFLFVLSFSFISLSLFISILGCSNPVFIFISSIFIWSYFFGRCILNIGFSLLLILIFLLWLLILISGFNFSFKLKLFSCFLYLGIKSVNVFDMYYKKIKL